MFKQVRSLVSRHAVLLAVATLLAVGISAQAAVDTDIQSVITGATDTFSAVKTVIISIVLFMLGLKVVKMLRRA